MQMSKEKRVVNNAQSIKETMYGLVSITLTL